MSLSLGSTTIGSLYLGSTKVGAAYMGSTKVYASTPVTPDNVLIFEFDDATYDPSSLSTVTSAVWTQLSSSPNVWQWDARATSDTNWSSAFLNAFTWDPSGDAVKIKAAGTMTIPTVIGENTSSPWPGMFRGNLALTDVCLLRFPNVTASPNLFNGCKNLNLAGLYVPNTTALNSAFKPGNNQISNITRIGPITTSSALTNVEQMFYGCANLAEVPYFETSGVMNMKSMFNNCSSLTSVPLFNTSSATDLYYMFYNCSSLTSVPLFNTGSATSVGGMFLDCIDVESGALALYQQMSSQATPPSSHGQCFKNCGSSTTTGAAELAQIPADWGGTMAV